MISPLFKSRLSAQKSHTTANTRRSARPDDFATPFHVINHIPTAQQGNWLGGPDLSCQITSAGVSACVRREARLFADLHLASLSIPPDKLRWRTHAGLKVATSLVYLGSDRPDDQTVHTSAELHTGLI